MVPPGTYIYVCRITLYMINIMSSQKSTRDQLTRHNLGLIPNEKFNTNPKLLV